MITWLIVFYLLWVKIGLIRFFMLMGHKNHQDTLLDKVMLTGLMPIAYLMGLITRVRKD